jgi:hypothetical protein
MGETVTTAVACKVAGLKPQRFNEDVAAGSYTCAPKTDAGVARVFDEDDLVALTAYAQLRNLGLYANVAGAWVALLRLAIRGGALQGSTPSAAVLRFSWDGSIALAPADTATPPFMQLAFNITELRETVRERLAAVTAEAA